MKVKTQLLDVLNLQATDDQGQPVGSFTLNANGTSWSFSPNPNFNGTVTLNYNVSDGTAETAATNSFALASVNDIPELTGVKATLANGTEDLTYTISAADLLTGYTDADIDNDADSTQALSILGLSATGGFIADNGDGTYSFTPNPDVNGVITLNYVVSDGAGGNTLATNSFSLDAVNDLPIRTAGNVSTLFLLEDQAIASMGLSGLSYSVGGGTDENRRSNPSLTASMAYLRPPLEPSSWLMVKPRSPQERSSHSSSCKVCNSSQHQMLLDKLNSPSRSLMASAPSPKPLRSTSSTSTTHRCYQPMPSP